MLYSLIIILMTAPFTVTSVGYYDDQLACQRAGEQIRATSMEMSTTPLKWGNQPLVQYICSPTRSDDENTTN